MPNAMETFELKNLIRFAFSRGLAVPVRLTDLRFNADPVALKLVTYDTILLGVGTGSYLLSLHREQNAVWVVVTL